MLLDLLSYIRQILPPHWRNPQEIGIARVLFGPIMAILRGQEDFERVSLYKAGLTGQKIILQHYLQSEIDGFIYIKDEDGVLLDFTVIIPQALSVEQKKQVRDIVDTYKLASKRFEIRDAFSTSSVVTGTIQWTSGHPKLVDGRIGLAINKTGTYPVRVLRRGQDAYLLNENVSFVANQVYTTFPAPAGVYDIQLGSLVATLDLSIPVQRVCDLRYDDIPNAVDCYVEGNTRKVRAYLYSSFANIAPFTFELFSYNGVTGEQGALVYSLANIPNPQPLVITIPNTIAADNYRVRYTDKDGCITPNRIISVPPLITIGQCTIAFDDSAGVGTAVVASTVGQQYLITTKVILAQTNQKTLKLYYLNGQPIAFAQFSNNSQAILLPSGTVPQDIKVEVTEGSCSTGVRTITLPSLPSLPSASSVRTDLINIQKGSDGKWSDSEVDSLGNYDAWYFVGDVLYLDAAGNRKRFTNESFASGKVVLVRKLFLDRSFFNSAERVKNEMWRAGFGFNTEWILYNAQHKFTT